MAIRNYYLNGTTTSRYLPTGERAFSWVVGQSGKFLLDAEINQSQQLSSDQYLQMRLMEHPSGFLRTASRTNPLSKYEFFVPFAVDFVSDAFKLPKMEVLVADCPPITIEYTNTSDVGSNLIQLDPAPPRSGPAPNVQRTDFVFLEVFKVLIAPSPKAKGYVYVSSQPSDGDTITIGGVVLTARLAAPGVDEFQIGGTTAATATNIVNAINDGGNSFTTIVTAKDDGAGTANLIAVDPGSVGNAISLATSVPLILILSGPFLTGGADTSNKPSQSQIWRHGNVDSPAPVWLDDDMEDPVIAMETAQRVQVQYRIRVTGQTEAVDFKTQPDGFSNTTILAQGSQLAPVANYPFVPADNSTVTLSSDATAYETVDPGLWIAGDGTEAAATALGSVDGYVYAIPICFVFRLNDAFDGGAGTGFEPLNNTNGGLPTTHGGFVHPILGPIGANESDRPDGAFSDAIAPDNVMDLRKHVVIPGADLSTELTYQIQSLLDGSNLSWAIDTASKQTLGGGSGSVSTRYLNCNEIGRQALHGGTGIVDGDTARGVTIRSFDHVARTFSDHSTVERIVFEFIPSYDQATYPGKYVVQDQLGFSGWHEGDTLHLNLDALTASTDHTYLPPGSFVGGLAEFIFDFAPPGTTITDVLSIYHDEGDSTSGTPVDVNTEATTIIGLGTGHVEITLDVNQTSVDGGDPLNPLAPMVGESAVDNGSQRRILVEVEITYPRVNVNAVGAGTSDTPDGDLTPDTTPYPYGPLIENDSANRPPDWEALTPLKTREGFREMRMEYVASLNGAATPITETVISQDANTIVLSKRIYGDNSFPVTVTDVPSAVAIPVDLATTEYGSSSRVLKLGAALPAANRLCSVTYFAQEPVPQSGGAGAGYQVSTYFRSVSPQTVGISDLAPTVILPNSLEIEVLSVGQNIWTGQVSSGGVERPYPYAAPLDQIPVNPGSGAFAGEWEFAATSDISIADFNASVGNLTLQTHVPLDMTENITVETPTKDAAFRMYYPDLPAGSYYPTAMAQGLSGVVAHKVWVPALVRSTVDTLAFRKDEILLAIITRWAELDSDNTVRFVDSDNRTAVAFYRTKGQLLMKE